MEGENLELGYARNGDTRFHRRQVLEEAEAQSVININAYGYPALYHISLCSFNSLHFMLNDGLLLGGFWVVKETGKECIWGLL